LWKPISLSLYRENIYHRADRASGARLLAVAQRFLRRAPFGRSTRRREAVGELGQLPVQLRGDPVAEREQVVPYQVDLPAVPSQRSNIHLSARAFSA
jgi:hypothetical protein